jgi:glycosyltransferase involved in cell wall biosynthesis
VGSMTNSPFFSVIIPTYNRAKFIGNTVASVQSQEFQDFEIIIVDDGSTDNTEYVIASIKDERLRYFKIPNSERAVARNTGAANARGEYVTFLDSDDMLKPDHLATAYRFIKDWRDVEVFSLGYEVVRPDKEIVQPWVQLPSPINEKLLEGNFLSCLGVFIKKDVFLENRFNEDRELSGSEDYELWLRLAAKYPIYTVPMSTAYLIQHDSRSVINFSSEKLLKRMNLLEFYVSGNSDVIRKFGDQLNVFRSYNDLYTALHLAIMRKKKMALHLALRALRQKKAVFLNYRFWVIVKKILVD